MSFTSDIKKEILHCFSNENKLIYLNAEKFGETIVTTEKKSSLAIDYKVFLDISKLDEELIKCILKGAFLGAGCIVDPKIDYHFEIVFKSKACTDYIFNLLSLLDFTPKINKRNNSYIIYIKDSDQISTILSLLEANSSLLKFEEIRVEKEVKNSLNRTTNCEVANLTKTIKSSYKQLEAINKIKECGMYDSLSEKLKDTITLREKYMDESLEFISSKTKDTKYISKSGLKHRLDKIIKIAEQL